MEGLKNLIFAKNTKRKRVSSYDRTGGNDDRLYIAPGETVVIADIKGAGIINHIWMTHQNGNFVEEKNSLRKVQLKMYWDGEENPSVLVPLGDFFGMGHGLCKNYVSAPLQMSPEDGKALNSWWQMPFSDGAKIVVTNECEQRLILYFYIDYEELESLPENTLRFHACWHRELPTKGHDEKDFFDHNDWCFGGLNPSGDENYVVLEAKGKGHYCGCNINIHNLNTSNLWDWPGEGDDMIFVDGEVWPPNIHGTGTEDYVNMAWCPTQEYSAPYHGLILGGDDNWKGKITYYRYHILDPIMFEKDIRVTIEHGHNNNRSDDWSSTAYWYQTEPHMPLKDLPKVEDRLPILDEPFIRLGIIKTTEE